MFYKWKIADVESSAGSARTDWINLVEWSRAVFFSFFISFPSSMHILHLNRLHTLGIYFINLYLYLFTQFNRPGSSGTKWFLVCCFFSVICVFWGDLIDLGSCIFLYKNNEQKYISDIPMCKSKYHDLMKAFDLSVSCTVTVSLFISYLLEVISTLNTWALDIHCHLQLKNIHVVRSAQEREFCI